MCCSSRRLATTTDCVGILGRLLLCKQRQRLTAALFDMVDIMVDKRGTAERPARERDGRDPWTGRTVEAAALVDKRGTAPSRRKPPRPRPRDGQRSVDWPHCRSCR